MTQSLDYRLGYRYASEVLHEQSVNQMEALVSGLQKWKPATAKNLINAANARIAAGINVDYQCGVIARAQLEIE